MDSLSGLYDCRRSAKLARSVIYEAAPEDCHHNTTMPVATLVPRYAAETPFPEVWGGFRCSACGSQIDARPNWAARQASGQILRP